ncbi:MAG: hypothetical protein DI628_05410 [Blastochloris viridis]|uniref:Uncharacterized protein n=1 Tax=Blastochloris viridis TaxID=1079 RepID=A0A6N4REE2_BLAVI|nr:MAG: hypothetical protein DI628_05410 [Blastochloris viridis]
MRYTSFLLTLPLCGFAFSTVSAQETVAGGTLDTQMSWAALKGVAEQANGNAKTSLALATAIRDCGIKDMIYSPGTNGADANGCKKIFDPKELMVKTGQVALGPCGSGAHSCAPDSRTTEHLCQQGGYSYATGTSVKGYSSPKNNWIGRWTGTRWQVFNAREANSFLLSLTCQTITWK